MISPENFVYDAVSDELKLRHPGIFVTGEYVDVPAKFPAVTIVEASNIVLDKMRTVVIEEAVTLMYEVNIFSNLIGYKKSEAQSIRETVDEVFRGLGFTRMMNEPTPNLQDASIYRIFLRYRGVDRPEYTGDEIIHRIYTS